MPASLLSLNGAETRIRTADLLLTKQLLYQLSYFGVFGELRRPQYRARLRPEQCTQAIRHGG